MDIKITERLQNLRKEHGYSQEQLADELGVSRQAVSKWERGEASPDTDNLIALARLYGITVDEVLFEKPERIPEETADEKKEPLNLLEIKKKLENGEEVEICGEVHKQDKRSHMDTTEGIVAGVTVMICCIAYFVLGGVWGLWHPAWIVFLAIPVFPTIPAAIRQRDMKAFCFPVLVVAVYLLLGCVWGLWHPWWVVFFTIPIYYIIADAIKKK